MGNLGRRATPCRSMTVAGPAGGALQYKRSIPSHDPCKFSDIAAARRRDYTMGDGHLLPGYHTGARCLLK